MDLTNNQAPMPTPEPKNKTWLWILIVIIVALLAGGGVYYWQNQQAQKQNQTATEKIRNEMQIKITEAENKTTELINKLSETETKLNELEKNQSANRLCTDDPTTSAIGSKEYPIDPRYQNLGHLGQLFTASDCNDTTRLSKIFGVSGDNYTLGVNLSLNNKPSAELLTELKKIGFTCRTKDAENNCLGWRLDKTVKINSIISIKPFYNELKFSDCINCG